MSRRTHSRKRTHTKRNPKHKPSHVFSRRYDWRTKVLAGAIAFVLLAGGTLAHWRAKSDEVLVARNTPPSPVKNISTASARDLADIPPEALRPQPPMAAGYNAHSGGLPPGALPPGVVLPGMPMTQGGRTTAQGYGVYDGIRQQFTGKERDTETGLDYFGARYYSSAQGRFTSVDPENAGADLEDPQSWNGYAYARNNPLKYVDPDGLEYMVCDQAGNCQSHWDPQWKPLFNPDNAKSVGITLKGNRDSGVILNADGEQIGTYRFVGQDYWSDFQNGVVQRLRDPQTWSDAARGAVTNAAVRGNARLGQTTPRTSGQSAGAMRRLQYEGSPKHGQTTRGNIGAAPRNGQAALDNSVQVKATSPRRVGVDYETGEFVVFDRTLGNTYHGHVRTWDQLEQGMKNALKKSGMTDARGRIQ